MNQLENLDTLRSAFTKESRVVLTEGNINKLVEKINEIVDYINSWEERKARALASFSKLPFPELQDEDND